MCRERLTGAALMGNRRLNFTRHGSFFFPSFSLSNTLATRQKSCQGCSRKLTRNMLKPFMSDGQIKETVKETETGAVEHHS